MLSVVLLLPLSTGKGCALSISLAEQTIQGYRQAIKLLNEGLSSLDSDPQREIVVCSPPKEFFFRFKKMRDKSFNGGQRIETFILIKKSEK